MAEGWEGIAAVTEKLRKVREGQRKASVRALFLMGRNTLNRSNKYVPHEEGDLERDGGNSVDEQSLRAAVAYGRSAHTRDYAVPQHERMDYHHDNGRTAKFLERAVNETRAENLQIAAEQIRGETSQK